MMINYMNTWNQLGISQSKMSLFYISSDVQNYKWDYIPYLAD